MTESTPYTIQILERDDYTKQHIITLPSSPLAPLAPSSLRIQSHILGLTTNNFSYARLGHLLGWWDIHPLPPSTPAPFNNSSKYGRIAAWGYATIIASTVPTIPPGKSLFGFLPISTLPLDITIKTTDFDTSKLEVTDPHRQHLWKIYNRYEIHDDLETLLSTRGPENLAYDALMWGLFATSYNLSRYGFAWDENDLIHPGGSTDANWTIQDADLSGAVVVCLSASGKTGMSFAHQIKRNRPEDQKPSAVIGVCSTKSQQFTENTGFYDDVVLYSSNPTNIIKTKYPNTKKIIILDFGARQGVMSTWRSSLSLFCSENTIAFRPIRVGGEVKAMSAAQANEYLSKLETDIVVHASALREKGIERKKRAYFEEFERAWEGFKRDGGIPGLKVRWGEGMGGWEGGWDGLARDEVGANVGLVFRV